MSRRRLRGFAALLLASCASAPERERPNAASDAAADAAPDATAPPARCRPAPGVSGAPRTIAEVAALANALPHPLSLTCFLESLDRPLQLSAAVSTISLQPAPTPRSPRIFLFSGEVIMSVVPEGTGKDLLELSQLVTGDRSLKAELKFPITAPLTPDDPFAHVRSDEGTTCRFCHPTETPAPEISANAFVSGAFSPLPRALVAFETLQYERTVCDAAAEPDRCAFLGALFDHGEVRARGFPATVPTAFDRRF
jgi:hypothetical protein